MLSQQNANVGVRAEAACWNCCFILLYVRLRRANPHNGCAYVLILFITFWILFSYLVPISLFVTFEIVKFILVILSLEVHLKILLNTGACSVCPLSFRAQPQVTMLPSFDIC